MVDEEELELERAESDVEGQQEEVGTAIEDGVGMEGVGIEIGYECEVVVVALVVVEAGEVVVIDVVEGVEVD